MSKLGKTKKWPSLLSVATIGAAVASIAIVLTILTGTAKLYNIPTGGMVPTFQPGDRILATRTFSSEHGNKRGQAVVFIPPNNPKTRYIQRVVALPGDTVELIDGQLAVNGILLKSPTGLPSRPAPMAFVYPGLKPPIYPLTLGQEKVFVLGDNYENSLDSRYFGLINLDDITHMPRAIVHPPSRMGGFE